MAQASLPVTDHRSGIMRAILGNQVTLVFGPTGSGKTTQIPQFLLDSELVKRGLIACTEPKRIAAMAAASRVASERNTEVGEEVGYIVRHERQMSDRTKLYFMTVGVLLRIAVNDPLLTRYAGIIVDEAHERDQFTDVLLGYLKRVCRQRPDFKLVVMSATLRHREFLNYFPTAKLVNIAIRQHPIQVVYRPTEPNDLIASAADAVQEIHRQTKTGDILVFMPGEREIRELINRLQGLELKGIKCLPLYGHIGPAHQRLVFGDYPERKVIVATNIAESSVTINNLTFVIDSGLAKQDGFDPYADVHTLELGKISLASAEQRAGRTGRNGPGVCIRLYSEADLNRRLKYPEPEIVRQDLTGLLLAMKSLGLDRNFEFLTEPDDSQWEHAEQSLRDFGALQSDGRLTESGQVMALLPLDPRLAHLVMQSVEYGCVQEAVTMAAMLSIGRFFVRELYEQAEFQAVKSRFSDPESDFLTLLNIWDAYRAADNVEAWCRDHFVNPYWMRGADNIREQILTRLAKLGIPTTSNRNRDMIDLTILSAFKRTTLRFHRGNLYENRRWHHVKLDHHSVLGERTPQYVVSYELRSGGGAVYAHCNHQVQYGWVKELAPEVLEHAPLVLPEGIKPVRLHGELQVESGSRQRIIKVDIDLARSAATMVRSHNGRNIVFEESRFPVSLLPLSDHARLSVDRAGIATLAELPNSGQELSDLGIGHASTREILRSLDKLGLVRRSVPIDSAPEPRTVSGQITPAVPSNRIEAAFLDKPIEQLKLSGRALMILWGVGVQRINDLTTLTEKELLKKIKEFGKSGGQRSVDMPEINGKDVVQEVKSRLMHFNLRLNPGKETGRGFKLDSLPTQLPPAEPIDAERAIDMLGLMYPYFKTVREAPPGDDGRIFCRNGIAEVNLGLPGRFCRNIYWYWKMVDDPMLEYEDLFQEGCIGLLWAIEKYDYTRGFALSTYAVQWITQNIFRAVDNATVLPVHVIDGLRKWMGRYHRMTKIIGHEPSREEFAEEMGKSVKWAESFFARMQFWKHFISLDQPAKNGKNEEEGSSLLDFQAVEDDPSESIDRQKLRSIMEQVLNNSPLQDVDKEILRLRHGLNGQRPHTLEEVGEYLGVTRERVRQREELALETLRTVDVWEQIHEFVPDLPIPTSRSMAFIVDDSGLVTKQKVSDLKAEPEIPPTVDEVVNAIATAHGFTREELLESKRRDDLMIIPRRIAMHILHVDCRKSFAEIGELLKISADGVRQVLTTSTKLQTAAQPILDAIYIARYEKEVGAAVPAEAADQRITVGRILDVVADYYGVTRGDILGQVRTKKAVTARHVAMHLVRRELQLSFPEIGEIFERDHTTVLSACQKISAELQKVPTSRGVIDSIRLRLGHTPTKGGES